MTIRTQALEVLQFGLMTREHLVDGYLVMVDFDAGLAVFIPKCFHRKHRMMHGARLHFETIDVSV